MPAIWNVNNSYGATNKKMSSKLTFEVGEKFVGRISSDADEGSVSVKLTDGWEFPAELQDSDIQNSQGLMQFEVTGYDDGKIKLAILKNSLGKEQDIDDNLKEFASKAGIEEDDVSLLKSMIEHDISLTKDNIVLVKSLTDFNKKIKNDPEEINKFISKYLESKGIEENSEQGSNIKNLLNDFLNKYQGMSKEDILLFIENNIDINKENIDSFNKMFKGDQNMKEILDDIKSFMDNVSGDNPQSSSEISDNNPQSSSEILDNNPQSSSEISDNNSQSSSKISDNKQNVITDQDNIDKQDQKQNIVSKNPLSKLYEANDSNKSKLSVIGLLKSLSGSNSDILKEPLRQILSDRSSNISSIEYKNISSKIEIMNDQDFLNSIARANNNNNTEVAGLTKESIQKALNNVLGQKINLSDSEASKIKDFIYAKLGNKQSIEVAPKNSDDYFISNNQKVIVDFDKFKQNIIDVLNNRRNSFHGLLRNNAMENIQKLDNSKLENIIQQKLNKFNVIKKENYNTMLTDLLGNDVNLIKDELDGFNECIATKNIEANDDASSKNILKNSPDSSYDKYGEALKNNKNIKELLNESLKNVKHNFSNNDIKTIEKNINNIPSEKLTNIIKEEMIKSNINLETRVLSRVLEDKTLLPKEISDVTKNIKLSRNTIEGDLKNQINDMKDIVKEIIQKTSNNTTLSSKIMDFINSNANDFKMFNSFSNEYYYLDMPVAANNKEYPCKLIIKDKRKDSKKIDKTSIKMVVAVKTINIGKVDGYLYVRNNKLDVDLKCEKEYMKLLSIAKNKLRDKLNEIGFSSDVKISEKKEDVNLSTCRQFFSSDNSRRIDTKV